MALHAVPVHHRLLIGDDRSLQISQSNTAARFKNDSVVAYQSASGNQFNHFSDISAGSRYYIHHFRHGIQFNSFNTGPGATVTGGGNVFYAQHMTIDKTGSKPKSYNFSHQSTSSDSKIIVRTVIDREPWVEFRQTGEVKEQPEISIESGKLTIVADNSPRSRMDVILNLPERLQYLGIDAKDFHIQFDTVARGLNLLQANIVTNTGDVRGILPFERQLFIESTSGDVGITLKNTKSFDSELVIKTKSGNINLNYARALEDTHSYLPSPNSTIHIESVTGCVDTQIAMVRDVAVETISGTLKMSILPTDDILRGSKLRMCTTSGNQRLRVLEASFGARPVFSSPPAYSRFIEESLCTPDEQPPAYSEIPTDNASCSPEHSNAESIFDGLTFELMSTSGCICIQYPPFWKGKIDVQATKYGASINGRDLEITRQESPSYSKAQCRSTGPAGNWCTRAHTISGNVSVCISNM